MTIRNFLKSKFEDNNNCHGGKGTLKQAEVFIKDDFATNIRFIYSSTLPPNTSIGLHKHGDNEELYIILEGDGVMTVDGRRQDVHAGDVILNKPFGTHGLENNSDKELKILVLEVTK